jgi:hypothetical protein
MDALERDWWAKRRLTYNLFLIFAGVTAFAGFVIVGETACTSDPDFEITMFTIAFQAIGYVFAMAVANVFYGLGPGMERLFKPQNLSLYRRIAFGAGATLSIVIPFVVPVALFVQCAVLGPP